MSISLRMPCSTNTHTFSRVQEIHGNAFVEKCEKCGVEYIRDFPVETLGFRCTPHPGKAEQEGT